MPHSLRIQSCSGFCPCLLPQLHSGIIGVKVNVCVFSACPNFSGQCHCELDGSYLSPPVWYLPHYPWSWLGFCDIGNLPKKDTVTKATNKRRSCLIGLTVPEGRVYDAGVKTWRRAAGAAAENSHLDLQAWGREHTGNGRSIFLKPQRPSPVAHLFWQDHTSSSFPNSSIYWGPTIQTYGPMRATCIQPAHLWNNVWTPLHDDGSLHCFLNQPHVLLLPRTVKPYSSHTE